MPQEQTAHTPSSASRWQRLAATLRATPWRVADVVRLAAGVVAGWIAFDDTWIVHHGQQGEVAQGFILGAMLLALVWRGVNRPRQAYVIMLGWYLGACAVIPGIWAGFFGGTGGVAIWIVLSILLASAYLLPGRYARFGLVTGVLLTTIPPLGLVGMASPLLAAGALFPGLGWAAIALMLIFLLLSGIPTKWAEIGLVAMALWGIVHVGQPMPQPPAAAWGMQSYEGAAGSTIADLFARQDRFKTLVRQALLQGAKLIVVPEGADPLWDDGQAFYWSDIARLAKQERAQVLLGVYTRGFPPRQSVDGLVDLTTGKLYRAAIPMPIGMWKPWESNPWVSNFLPDLSVVETLPTAYEIAAYSICYENLLLWPLLHTMVASHHHPVMLIAADNQWFAGERLATPQMRSLRMQAAIFRLPLVRAINWPKP